MADETNASPVQIIARENGPYLVEGLVSVRDTDGNEYRSAERTFLCRCGASVNKPFCDGTHSKMGFEAAERAVAAEGETPA